MARFTDDLTVVNRLSGNVHHWELLEAMTYRLVDSDDSELVIVPPGFETDFASVPRIVWSWIAPWGRHGRAAVVHDFLYQLGSVTNPTDGTVRRPGRLEADRIFRHAMAVLDRAVITRNRFWGRMPKPVLAVRLFFAAIRRWLMWLAVVLFGHWAYRRQQKVGTAPALERRMLAAPDKSG